MHTKGMYLSVQSNLQKAEERDWGQMSRVKFVYNNIPFFLPENICWNLGTFHRNPPALQDALD